jgi:L,D-peptidoglycan transpeptidase YkuD (ErfK/YbiS/YcfS/YnhG family)
MARRRVSRHMPPLLMGALMILARLVPAADSPVADSRQLVVVVVPDWNAARGTLATFERDPAGGWRRRAASHPVLVGRNGSAWGRGLHPLPEDGPRKREGDGRSPAGIFTIGPAFGGQPTCETGLEYRPLTADDWCIDVAASPLYNQIVDARKVGAAAVAGSTEPMRRDLHLDGDRSYELGFVIGHNAAGHADEGSCIFAHLLGDPPTATAGCTAMTEPQLRELLGWLDAAARPRFVLLPADEAAARCATWGLPPPPGDEPP